MKYFIFAFILFITIGCSVTKNGLTPEKIVFKKEYIGQRTIYHIDRPNYGNKTSKISLITDGHGHGFQITYSDSSTIYYSNDNHTSTPNYTNYKTINWDGYGILDKPKDTIIEGVLANGLLWKEIRKGNDFIGYTNVPQSNESEFDKSLLTLKK